VNPVGIKDLFFKITAKDQTGPAFGSVNRRLRETDGLSASVSERVGRAGRAMQKFGAAGSLASIGVAAAFRDVIGLYDEQARAEAKVAKSVRETGGAAGFTEQQLYDMASALQGVTRFGDEAILNGVTAQLLTFGNISGEVFEGAQKAVLDLATVLDGDLQSASIMLGKALNDPAKGLSAMSRAGITFSEAQAAVIKDLAKTGQVAEAQKLILAEIAAYYGGQADAAREAGAGIVDAWQNTWGDVKEVVGGVLIEILPPIIETLESITGWFQALTPEGQKMVVMLGGLAVAIPPVTLALGTMAIAVNALLGPVGLVIAGIAALATGVALLWPENARLTEKLEALNGALDDEAAALGALIGPLGADINLSSAAANQKLTEARTRYENVKAIIAEREALVRNSDEYRNLSSQLAQEGGLMTSGPGPTGHIDPELYRIGAIGRRMSPRAQELTDALADLVRLPPEVKDQLGAATDAIERLESVAGAAGGSTVDLGESLGEITVPAAELTGALGGGSGGGAGASGGLAGAVKDLAAETEDYAESGAWGTIKDNMRALLLEGQSWGDTFKNIFGTVVDKLFDLAFSPAWDSLWANMEGFASVGAGGPGGGAGGGLGGLLGGLTGWVGNILGLDTGGDVTVSGKGGVDRNLTVLRTSDNERVSVRRPGDAGGGPQVVVNIHTPNPAAFQSSRAQIGHQIGRAVAAGQRIA
jgi:hypothetical protein